MIDVDKSIEKSIDENERRLGRSLTLQEESAIKDRVNKEAMTEMGVGASWFLIIVAGAVWVLDKTTSVVGQGYSLYVEPYLLWMVQSHTDSLLNFLLQVYIWPIAAPFTLCLFLVCLPAIITAVLIMMGTGWLMSHAEVSLLGILSGLGGMLGILMLVVVPIGVFFQSVTPMSALVFTGYAICHELVKNKIFRLGKLSLVWWMFLTHIVIPAALILLVYFFAADESHIKNGRNVYSAEIVDKSL